MLIDVNEFIEKTNKNLNTVREKQNGFIDLEKYKNRSQYTVKIGKDISFNYCDRDMFSGSILRHIDANKCLFSALHRQLPKRANKAEYTLFYYEGERLIMSEFNMPGYGSRVTFYSCGENEKNLAAVFCYEQ